MTKSAYEKTRFQSVFELASLPWFEERAGRLVIADHGLGPVIDFHSHLALSYVFPCQVDLKKRHYETQHYLPVRNQIDLDIYINKNLTPEDLRRSTRDLTIKSLGPGGMRATHTMGNLAREMGELNVSRSVLLPIDMPVLSRNARTWLRSVSGNPEFICFGSVHPYRYDLEAELAHQHALGARGVKVHPAVQLVAPENPRAMKLYELAGERGLPIFFHCGPVGIELQRGRELTQVRRYREPIEKLPGTTFILGHSGALQMEEALELAKRHSNVWLELSSQSLANVKKILEEGPADRIVYGSDWPWYHQSIGIAKVFLATKGRDDLRRKVLYENAVKLLGLREAAPRRIETRSLVHA